jgi:hypothetical protein
MVRCAREGDVPTDDGSGDLLLYKLEESRRVCCGVDERGLVDGGCGVHGWLAGVLGDWRIGMAGGDTYTE